MLAHHNTTTTSDTFDFSDNSDAFSDNGSAFGGAAAVAVKVAPAPITNVLYLSETTSQAPISVTDINQGYLSDCFVLSSIGEIVLNKPSFISNMIHANADGTESVTLYCSATNGSVPNTATSMFKPVTETITNTFENDAVNCNGQDVVGNQREIWPQVVEKAVAQLDGGYNAIANGGMPMIAMAELTGHQSTEISSANITLATLIADQAAGDMMVFDTRATGALTNNLVNWHCYMFNGVSGTGAGATINLINPWGFYQPTPIAFSSLAKDFTAIDINHV